MALSKDEARKCLQGMKLTDQEVEEMMSSFYQLAEILVEEFKRKKGGE